MKFYFFLLVSISLVFFNSCEDSSTTPDSSQIITFTASLSGSVKLYDENLVEVLLTDFSGVTISIDGTDYQTVSDSEGNWSIQNAKLSYDKSKTSACPAVLKYYKDGFAIDKRRVIIYEQTPNYSDNDEYLFMFPRFYADSLKAVINKGKLELSAIAKTDDENLNLVWNKITKNYYLFYSDKSLINDVNNYKYYSTVSAFYNKDFERSINLNDLYDKGFQSGSKVYFICAGVNNYDNSYYENGYDGTKIFSGISQKLSNEIEVVLP